MKKLKVAIVGCGRIAVCYEDTFMRFPDIVEPVFAVDKVINKAKEFAGKFPSCKYTDNYDEILKEDIDVVHLCLPHYLHPHMAVKAMQAGIHVITEKPIAITLQEADLMLCTQRETGVKLGVIFQTRYTKSVTALKAMIDRGDFGRIISARSYLTWNRPFNYYDESDWKGTWDKEGGGVLIDQAIHSIDRVRYLVGSDVSWIDGSIHNYVHDFVKVEDTANAIIGFENGCLYNLYACNTYGLDSPIYIELAGEKGRCGLIHDTGFYEIGDTYEEIKDEYVPASVGPVYWGSSHYIQLRDFYDSVLQDTPVAVDGTEGRKTLEIIKGIYLSSASGRRVNLPFTDATYTDINIIKS
ncbi:putative 4,5-dihydroxyphthalate dehydrogenase [Lachnospiraceae bacterium]|nr:putative 4,5-dihydroxyphthalate dehydrogenase [Lachnospiraceae bacterium]